MWENRESNYHEEDSEKLQDLYDKVGITEEVFAEYPEEYSKQEEIPWRSLFFCYAMKI